MRSLLVGEAGYITKEDREFMQSMKTTRLTKILKKVLYAQRDKCIKAKTYEEVKTLQAWSDCIEYLIAMIEKDEKDTKETIKHPLTGEVMTKQKWLETIQEKN